jgi:hypothetical protein
MDSFATAADIIKSERSAIMILSESDRRIKRKEVKG